MGYYESSFHDLNIPSDLANRAIDKDWKETASHMGPHRYTPLRQALESLTTAALLVLTAGSMLWAYERLRKYTNAEIVRDLSEAILCYQVDPLYLNPLETYRSFPLTLDFQLPEGAVAVYPWIFFEDYDFKVPRHWPAYPPVIETARTIYLTRYIMPKQDKRYEKWAEAAIKKIGLIARLPEPLETRISSKHTLEGYEADSNRVIGQPLSTWALNVNEAFDPVRNNDEIDKMLQAASPAGNPFLRDATDLKKMGFVGTPYRYPQ